jgi:hypothetical protein
MLTGHVSLKFMEVRGVVCRSLNCINHINHKLLSPPTCPLFIHTDTHTYRVIKKSLCTLWLQYSKLQVMFKVSFASLQTFIDTSNCVIEDRVQYSTVHIRNVFCGYNLQIISCLGIVRIHWGFACFCNVIIRCTENFWSSGIYIYTLYLLSKSS